MRRKLLIGMALFLLGGLTLGLQAEEEGPKKRNRGKRPARSSRWPDKLQQGQAAPDFTLKTLDGKSTVKLSSFQGQKPVALVFGSYT